MMQRHADEGPSSARGWRRPRTSSAHCTGDREGQVDVDRGPAAPAGQGPRCPRRAARDIRAYICEWIQARPKRTILLTTHYLHEGEELCDRVAIIHQGQIIACDTPAALRQASQEGTEFVLTTAPLDGATWLVDVPGVRRSEIQERDGRSELRVHLDNDAAIAALVRALADRDREIFALEKIEPSLEDAFMELVGRRMSELDEPEGRP